MITETLTTSPLLNALGWAVLHFLWQGCVIAAMAALLLSGLRDRSAQAKYMVGCLALACSLLAFVTAFAIAPPIEGPSTGPSSVTAALEVEGASSRGYLTNFSQWWSASRSGLDEVAAPVATRLVPLVASLWSLGVMFLTIRLLVRWMAVRRMEHGATADVGTDVRHMFVTLCEDLGLRKAVRFCRSRMAEVPMVVGWFSPVVVVPLSAFTSLTPDQLRAVLAHELAHIRRYDYLVNGIQSMIEVILFFHPAVWWISGQVRKERELCCDDIAVQTVGNPMVFARALSRLEALRDEGTQVALAANGGLLMQRIQRIVGINVDRSVRGSRPFVTGITIALLMVVVSVASLTMAVPLKARSGESHAAETAGKPTFEEVEAEVTAAVASGKITQEQADRKMVYLREHWDVEAGQWIEKSEDHDKRAVYADWR